MEQLFFLLIPVFASSSIISAGNDTSIQTTLPPNTNATSLWSVDSRTEVQTEKTMTSTFSSQYENSVTSHISKTVSTSTAPVSSSHTGLSIITSSVLTTQKSNVDSTLNSTSSPVAKITGFTSFFLFAKNMNSSTDGSGLSSHVTSVSVSILTANSNISMSEGTPTPSQAPDSGLTLLAFGVMSLILILIVVMGVLVTAINLRGRCRDTKQHKDTDSPQMSSVHSTTLDNADQEFTRDLLGINDGL